MTRRGALWRAALSGIAMVLLVIAGGPDTRNRASGRESAEARLRLRYGQAPPAKHDVFVVFQLADCESRVEFARIFERPRLAASLSATGLFVGSASQYREARAALARRQVSMVVQRLDRKTALGLRSLGFRQTPFLIVLDGSGQTRLAASLPRTNAQYVQTVARLEQLALPRPLR